MQVVLLEDINKLGKMGDLVKVKPGYARNFLLPEELAVFADPVTLAIFEKKKAKLEEQAQGRKDQAEANKEKFESTNQVVIKANAGPSGKLYGSITKEMIADAIKEQLDIEIDRHRIKIDSAVNAIGDHSASLNLGSNVTTEINIKVVPLDS